MSAIEADKYVLAYAEQLGDPTPREVLMTIAAGGLSTDETPVRHGADIIESATNMGPVNQSDRYRQNIHTAGLLKAIYDLELSRGGVELQTISEVKPVFEFGLTRALQTDTDLWVAVGQTVFNPQRSNHVDELDLHLFISPDPEEMRLFASLPFEPNAYVPLQKVNYVNSEAAALVGSEDADAYAIANPSKPKPEPLAMADEALFQFSQALKARFTRA